MSVFGSAFVVFWLENSWFNKDLPYTTLVHPSNWIIHRLKVLHFDISFLYFLYSQAIKECIHHATCLSEGVLRVGTLGWPLEVSASHMTQLQFASTVENIMETALHQV